MANATPIDPKSLRAVQDAVRSVDPSTFTSFREAVRSFDTIDTSALRKAFGAVAASYAEPGGVGREIGEAMARSARSAGVVGSMSERDRQKLADAIGSVTAGNHRALAKTLAQTQFAAVDVARFCDAFAKLDLPKTYSLPWAELVRKVPVSQPGELESLAPDVEQAVNEAAVIAETEDVEAAAEALARRLRALPPAERLTFATAVWTMIVEAALLYALLARDLRVTLAAQVFSLIPPLMLIAWYLSDGRDEDE